MRTITDHKVNGLNEALEIIAADQPGPGGANHEYSIWLAAKPSRTHPLTDLSFQNGPIGEAGINGISNEALLAVLIDRMRGFQGMSPVHPCEPGKEGYANVSFWCHENERALTHLEEAMMWLQKRTRDRMARGVEGTSKV